MMNKIIDGKEYKIWEGDIDSKWISRLPKWAQERALALDRFQSWGSNCYHMIIVRLPEDKRVFNDKNDKGGDVFFSADNLKELKWELAYYKSDFARFGYDY
jgi:hypothetical protein